MSSNKGLLMSNRALFLTLVLASVICVATWTAAIWATGDRLDCQQALPSGFFCALRTRTGAGLSVQYAGGLSVWKWAGPGSEGERRLWPR